MTATTSQFDVLFRRASNGSDAALGELLDRHRGYLKVLSRRYLDLCGPLGLDASDIVQQACLSAVGGFREFRGTCEAEFLAWLRGIHRHTAADAVRRSLAQKRGGGGHVPLADDPLVEQTSPSQRLLQGEAAVELAAAVEALPPEQREAVRLRHLEGWPLARIAEHMGRSQAAVAGLLKRGLSNLRTTLRSQE
jgi:RNA polymerase sigma-70 factor (ECF subfamily)